MKITVIPGDGIGPAITDATIRVLSALECDLEFAFCTAGETALREEGALLPEKTLQSIGETKVALKGPITTPVGEGFTSVNVQLRQHFNLFANVRPVRSYPGISTRYDSIDLITLRQNTEGMYAGEGQFLSDDGSRAEAKSVITRAGSEEFLRYAFQLARSMGRTRLTLLHKANILKSTSGLFLSVGRSVKKEFPDLEYGEMIVDAAAMNLVKAPEQFDMLVTTNLLGDIISDLCAGLVGGLGMAPGANIGADTAIFEAVHGSAPDIAGKDLANPSALLLAAALLLDHIGMPHQAIRIRRAIEETTSQASTRTVDLGGTLGTQAYTDLLISYIHNQK
ncbi:isocitrate dehydrogenase [Chitinivibrio alkaliphilus]|uniref:Isocitrate dehydrogenase (NAD(+)) n=1 Tax=Chitinivibrio alkaliphilus ACht1 TaxID=1313304 RepID=U7D7Q7_9BACT|nr:isocitrate dehydrogenase [Chitinivibrio alkaliphilus]ERP31968.1 Isocitrate dehydrogenase (NAD(+)) [Chitinivibrio alkaliphilus ACht1]